jgi:hypothetical protein
MTTPASPVSIALIAATLMGRGEDLSEEGDIFKPHFQSYRKHRIKDITALASDLLGAAASIAETREPAPEPKPENIWTEWEGQRPWEPYRRTTSTEVAE